MKYIYPLSILLIIFTLTLTAPSPLLAHSEGVAVSESASHRGFFGFFTSFVDSVIHAVTDSESETVDGDCGSDATCETGVDVVEEKSICNEGGSNCGDTYRRTTGEGANSPVSGWEWFMKSFFGGRMWGAVTSPHPDDIAPEDTNEELDEQDAEPEVFDDEGNYIDENTKAEDTAPEEVFGLNDEGDIDIEDQDTPEETTIPTPATVSSSDFCKVPDEVLEEYFPRSQTMQWRPFSNGIEITNWSCAYTWTEQNSELNTIVNKAFKEICPQSSYNIKSIRKADDSNSGSCTFTLYFDEP